MKVAFVCLILIAIFESSFGKRKAQGADFGGRNRLARRNESVEDVSTPLTLTNDQTTQNNITAEIETSLNQIMNQQFHKSNEDDKKRNNNVISQIVEIADGTKSVGSSIPSKASAEKIVLNRVVRYLRRDRDSRSRFE